MFTVIILTGICVVVSYYMFCRRWKNYPPGPFNYPIIGALPTLVAAHGMVEPFGKWADKYGDIFSFRMGPHEVVVLSNPALIREVYNKDVACGRPHIPAVQLRSELNGNSKGIVWAEG